MKAIFLADAHLARPTDRGYKRCLRFLAGLQSEGAFPGADPTKGNRIDLLVIAGDFFDFWFERNGRIYPDFHPIVKSIARLKDEGVRICICEGNHDFFLADFFEKRLGFEVYPEALDLAIDNLKVFISHGDTVDRNNGRYLALRRFLRSSFTYRLQRIIPLSLLFAIARNSSRMSRGMTFSAQQKMVETMRLFAEEKFREGFDAVILGHCHAQSLTQEEGGGKQRIFATLGDWINLYSYLVYENGRFSLHQFDRGEE
jgi:UDP-2,3-diacylglucosamine hydrolase